MIKDPGINQVQGFPQRFRESLVGLTWFCKATWMVVGQNDRRRIVMQYPFYYLSGVYGSLGQGTPKQFFHGDDPVLLPDCSEMILLSGFSKPEYSVPSE
jgi:hypothetical protein